MRKKPTPWYEGLATCTSAWASARGKTTFWWCGLRVLRVEADAEPLLPGHDCGCKRVQRPQSRIGGRIRRWVLIPCIEHGVEIGKNPDMAGCL